MLGRTGIVVTFPIQHSNFNERGQISKIYFYFYFFLYLQNFDSNAIFNVRINKLRNKNFFLLTTGFEPLTVDTAIERANHLPTETLEYKILELIYFLPAFTRES